MAMGLDLTVRQTQSLVLTPQLQQAIRLLQFSAPELREWLQREALQNPFLRLEEPPRGAVARGAGSGGEPDEGWQPPPAPVAADSRLSARRLATNAFDDAEFPLEQRLAQPVDLREHLRRQLGVDVRDARIRSLALALVDHLEEDGYLREADAALAERLQASEAEILRARRALQRCEPTGVGARDLAECLALQLAERDRLDPCMRRLLERLDLVARADFGRLMRLCRVDREDLEEMIAEIRALDPRPGLQFVAAEPETAVPDLFVRRVGGRWRVELNGALLPRVLVDRDWQADLTAGELDPRTREYVGEQLQSANWLVRALEQRTRTLLRVARAVFSHQKPFLEEGARALRPLTLRQIAERLSIHESTVSRAVAGKYVSTPHGTWPFRAFFSAALPAAGGSTSAEAIRRRIRELVDREDPRRVLSDDRIVALLREEGIEVARRTVAKYREAMGIPSSVERRRRKALAG